MYMQNENLDLVKRFNILQFFLWKVMIVFQ